MGMCVHDRLSDSRVFLPTARGSTKVLVEKLAGPTLMNMHCVVPGCTACYDPTGD